MPVGPERSMSCGGAQMWACTVILLQSHLGAPALHRQVVLSSSGDSLALGVWRSEELVLHVKAITSRSP